MNPLLVGARLALLAVESRTPDATGTEELLMLVNPVNGRVWLERNIPAQGFKVNLSGESNPGANRFQNNDGPSMLVNQVVLGVGCDWRWRST